MALRSFEYLIINNAKKRCRVLSHLIKQLEEQLEEQAENFDKIKQSGWFPLWAVLFTAKRKVAECAELLGEVPATNFKNLSKGRLKLILAIAEDLKVSLKEFQDAPDSPEKTQLLLWYVEEENRITEENSVETIDR